VRQALDEERGPRLVLADGTQSIYLADMSGDGLTDLVRIRNGEVCYWPNVGHGRFGAKVAMDNAPRLDGFDQFEQSRVRLADIDGSGTTDIVYLGRDGVRLYFNQSGNRWSEARRLEHFPPVDNVASVTTVDLQGNGTTCLVWSSPLPAAARRPLRYVDLMGGTKPHLLVKAANNLGAETVVRYAASTRFYLADKQAGRPWVTRLPFPVHVVERVVTHDRISGNRFTTRYAYHHGHFEGTEREFRGFGMVEQYDTEELAALAEGGLAPAGTNVEEASHVPPVLTKSWFHTGVHLERGRVSDYFAGLCDPIDAGEYFREPGLTDAQAQALLLDDTILPDDLSPEEEREACRALKGSLLRQEVYGLDGSVREPYPYSVTEQNFTVRLLQPRADQRHGVFFTHARETITYHYERDPADPRVGHALTLEVDEFGNVLKSASVGYGRRQPDLTLPIADRDRQAQILVTYNENRFTHAIDSADTHRLPLPCESRAYEVTGLGLPPGSARFTFEQLLSLAPAAIAIDYERKPTPGLHERRLIEHVRTYYRRDDLTAALPLGDLQSLALPFENYKLAFTPGFIASVYAGRATNAMLAEGGYVHTEGDASWWIPSGRVFYSADPAHTPAQELAFARKHFFLPLRYRDPFHTSAVSTESFVTYDLYDLLIHETRDPLGNRVTAAERHLNPNLPPVTLRLDYRVLQPSLVMDPNRNRSAVVFDVLGMVVGTAVMGKPEELPVPGDRIDPAFQVQLTQAEIDQFLADPRGTAAALLGAATTRIVYDLTPYWRETDPSKKPPALAATIARETHGSDVPQGDVRVQVSVAYSDGFGREIQKKVQAEPGPAPLRDVTGRIVVGPDGQPQMTGFDVDPRWVGSGWTVFNNKGKPVRKYEPYFTDTHRFEFDVRIGVSPILFYDPVERVVATLHPNHAWEKILFNPWRQETWDANDTALIANPKSDAHVGPFFSRLADAAYLPTWHAQRADPAHAAAAAQRWPDLTARQAETRAAHKTAVHAATPTVSHTDSLGRGVLAVAHNRFKYSDTPPADPPVQEFQRTRTVLDIEGNQREVSDGLDRLVMRYDYDLLGNRLHQSSMESGERWTLNDVAGKPLYAWNSRGLRSRTTSDALRRPTESFLKDGAAAEVVVARQVYGESRPNPEAANLRGRVVQAFDQAGVVTTDLYDFKGNLLRSARQLAVSYESTLDWSAVVALQADTYVSATRYDALNRPVQMTAPHGGQPGTGINVIQPEYNEANLLERVHVWLGRNAEPGGLLDPTTADLPAVRNLDYDAKGQRRRVDYPSASTSYEYDPVTFRLTRLVTRRDAGLPDDCPTPALPGWPGCQVQNLTYTYDPAGNITQIRDAAQQAIYFRNRRIDASSDYTYDALYRLIEATGREHLGQAGGAPATHSYNDVPRTRLPHPGDGNAMGLYLERYIYDVAGNILSMQHRGSDPVHPGWTRTYAYSEPSLVEPGRSSNRLNSTTVGATTETYSAAGDGYDAHGSMLRMPHLQAMQWDFKDQLQMTRRQAVDPSDAEGVLHQGERTWYVYDAAGQRVRKVTELPGGQIKEERIYLANFELYRRGGLNPLVRETLHLMDDKQRVALVETRTQGNEPGVPSQLIRYQMANHFGSGTLELDDAGQVLSYEEYTPYGSTSYQAVRNQIETPKRYRYTGKERDEESGLYYFGARHYSPWIGRWTSADPAGLVDGPNVYVYSRLNPIVLRDPDGRQTEEHCYVMHPTLGEPMEVLGQERNMPGVWCTSASAPGQSRVDPTPQAGADRSFWSRGGGTLAAGGVGLGIGALILLSGPVGWFGGLLAAMAIASGTAGLGIGGSQLALSYSNVTTPEQDAELNRAAGYTLTLSSSPGSLLGGLGGLAYSGDPETMNDWAFYGGLGEAGGSMLYGGTRMALREVRFGLPARSGWKSVRPGMQEAFDLGTAAQRARPNPAFPRGTERIDLSHWVPQRTFRGTGWERFFNRPWNVKPMWAGEHALVDPFRLQFLKQPWRAAYEAQQLTGLSRQLRLAPTWALQVGYGAAEGGNMLLRRDLAAPPEPDEADQAAPVPVIQMGVSF
jgi:RHS repeat-associated protein